MLLPLRLTTWLELAIDDTVAGKRGIRVFGASMHVDPVTSTKKRKNFVLGHCWTELGVILTVPWSSRAWFIPVLSRLYRGKKEAGAQYRTKNELAREMLNVVLGWLPVELLVRLMLDSGYMNKNVLKGLPFERLTVFGSLKTNAALFRPLAPGAKVKGKRGRPRKRGERLPTPTAMNKDRRRTWKKVETTVGAKTRTRETLSFQAQWYGVLGDRLCRVVLVREDDNMLRVVLCTDPLLSTEEVLEQGARRWPIEVWNRDVKQILGFADSPAWSEGAVRHTAPWVALLSGILVVWFHRMYSEGMRVSLPERPWYTTKQDLSFADLVRAAQETLRGVDLRTWAQAIQRGDPEVFNKTKEGEKAAEPHIPEEEKRAMAA